MSNLERCIELLDSIGADVLDVGCHSQENTPLSVDDWQGVLIFVVSGLLLYVVDEIARDWLKLPSS